MITVSTEYESAIVGTSRETRAKVIFDVVDLDAASDASSSVTGEADFSKKDQLFNDTHEMSLRYATFENDYWLLDGSFYPPPKSTETGYEVGWWSSALAGSDGTFSAAQELTIAFTKDHTSVGISISFDEIANEYPKDFTIKYYNSSNALIYTETVTNNELARYILEHTVSNFRKIVITITKWANGYRRARVAEVTFGIVYEYTGTDLVTMSVLEETDPINNTVPSNELNFTIDNSDKQYNLLNPDGALPALQRKQKITPYIGVLKTDSLVEYVKMGQFYLTDWKSDEGALTASFVGRDMLDILSQSEFAGATYTSKTIKYIAEAVFTAAGITDYYIDSALGYITVSGTLPKKDYRETLQTIAVAGCAVVFCDRDGTINLIQQSATASGELIDFDNVYSSPKINLATLVNTIIVDVSGSDYTYTDPSKPADEQVLSVKIENPLIPDNTRADAVAQWIQQELKRRFIYELNWRQNPAYEPGDNITVEDEFGENKTIKFTKQEFEFNGFLTGKSTGRA